MKIEISEEELICLLFWYEVFRGNMKTKDTDRNLFYKLRENLDFDKGVSLKECGVTGMPRYQPGEGNVKT